MKRFIPIFLVVAGCATPPGPAPTPEPLPPPAEGPPPPVTAPSRTENVAVARLMNNARADTAAGRLSNAAASLERALRLEPRNPYLWHELARVRLRQGEYAQAQSLAARSNTWAGSDSALREANERLIDEARGGLR